MGACGAADRLTRGACGAALAATTSDSTVPATVRGASAERRSGGAAAGVVDARGGGTGPAPRVSSAGVTRATASRMRCSPSARVILTRARRCSPGSALAGTTTPMEIRGWVASSQMSHPSSGVTTRAPPRPCTSKWRAPALGTDLTGSWNWTRAPAETAGMREGAAVSWPAEEEGQNARPTQAQQARESERCAHGEPEKHEGGYSSALVVVR